MFDPDSFGERAVVPWVSGETKLDGGFEKTSERGSFESRKQTCLMFLNSTLAMGM